MFEIERKWTLTKLPDFCKNYKSHEIEQCYISYSPEVRIRKSLNHKNPFMMTVKSEGGLKRIEIEKSIDEQFYVNLVDNFVDPKCIINKKFYKIPIKDSLLNYEISLVDGIWSYVEVEFPTEDEAKKFVAPSWFGREITDLVGFKMKKYSIMKKTLGDFNLEQYIECLYKATT